MKDTGESVREHLEPLLELRLSASSRAADMHIFQFGTMHERDRGAVGEYALHVQCPWRIESEEQIITGRHDLFSPADETPNFDWNAWDWDGNETLQDRIISDFLNRTKPLVEEIDADRYGGVTLRLSDGYNLVLFPAGSKVEDWRIFKPNESGHFVVWGGHVED